MLFERLLTSLLFGIIKNKIPLYVKRFLWRAQENTKTYSGSGDEIKNENRPHEFGDATDGSAKNKLEGNPFTGLIFTYILPRPRPKMKGGVYMEKKVLTVKEFMQIMGISRSAAYQMIAAGRVQVIRLNHKILIPSVWVEKLLRGE
ncbi:MAG: helix-turn-helix domain-containing protein [Negativicutes bacterium]